MEQPVKISCQFCLKQISGDTQIQLKHLKSYHSFGISYNCIFSNCYRKFYKFFTLEKHVIECSFRINQTKSVFNEIIQNDTRMIEDIYFEGESTHNFSFDNDNSSEEKDVLESNDIRNYVLKYIDSLYNKPNVPRLIVQEIVEELQETIQNISEHFHNKLKKKLPHEFQDILKNCFNISILEDVGTEYRRFEYLKKSKFFIQPKPFFIGNLYDGRKDGQKTILTIKKCEGQIVPMREILKSLLEIPNFYEKVLNIINTDSSSAYTNKLYNILIKCTLIFAMGPFGNQYENIMMIK